MALKSSTMIRALLSLALWEDRSLYRNLQGLIRPVKPTFQELFELFLGSLASEDTVLN